MKSVAIGAALLLLSIDFCVINGVQSSLPSSPVNLTVQQHRSGLLITWRLPDNSPLPIHYCIVQYRTVGDWVPLTDPTYNRTWFNWTTASSGVTYQFRAFSYSLSGVAQPVESLPSSTLTITTGVFAESATTETTKEESSENLYKSLMWLFIGISAALLIALCIILLYFLCWKKRKHGTGFEGNAKEKVKLIEIHQDAEALPEKHQEQNKDLVLHNREVEKHREDGPSQQKPQVEINFDSNATFVKTIRTKAAMKDGKAVFGLAVLDEELFVIHQHTSEVEVYDSRRFNFKRKLQVDGLYDPVDISSCTKNRCLYIFDWQEDQGNIVDPDTAEELCNKIVKFDTSGKLIIEWATNGEGGYLSVTSSGNIILSVWAENKMKEYAPDGKLIQEISLPKNVQQFKMGIKIDTAGFIVCYGEDDENQHGLCKINDKGAQIKSIGGKKGSSDGQFDNPCYMAVNKSGCILVADQNNKRVVLLSPDLDFKQTLFQENDGLRYPVRLDLDQNTGRLFIADNDYLEFTDNPSWRDGSIKVFDYCTSLPQ